MSRSKRSSRSGHGMTACGMTEHFDSRETLEKKVTQLADLLRASRHTVVYTGAGISTSAGIPDYRGPTGVWTLKARGKDVDEPDFVLREPTLSHCAMKTLMSKRLVRHIVTQNIDGLHRRSGVPPTQISELHGNYCLETCPVCGVEYFRDFAVWGGLTSAPGSTAVSAATATRAAMETQARGGKGTPKAGGGKLDTPPKDIGKKGPKPHPNNTVPISGVANVPTSRVTNVKSGSFRSVRSCASGDKEPGGVISTLGLKVGAHGSRVSRLNTDGGRDPSGEAGGCVSGEHWVPSGTQGCSRTLGVRRCGEMQEVDGGTNHVMAQVKGAGGGERGRSAREGLSFCGVEEPVELNGEEACRADVANGVGVEGERSGESMDEVSGNEGLPGAEGASIAAAPKRSHKKAGAVKKKGKKKKRVNNNWDGIRRSHKKGAGKEKEKQVLEVLKWRAGGEGGEGMPGGPRHDHRTGRVCEKQGCGGELVDSVVLFGESMPLKAMDNAEDHSRRAELALVLGSSLRVGPACDFPGDVPANGGKLVIINLQRTPMDNRAELVIHARCDEVMELLMEKLGLATPVSRPCKEEVTNPRPNSYILGMAAVKRSEGSRRLPKTEERVGGESVRTAGVDGAGMGGGDGADSGEGVCVYSRRKRTSVGSEGTDLSWQKEKLVNGEIGSGGQNKRGKVDANVESGMGGGSRRDGEVDFVAGWKVEKGVSRKRSGREHVGVAGLNGGKGGVLRQPVSADVEREKLEVGNVYRQHGLAQRPVMDIQQRSAVSI